MEGSVNTENTPGNEPVANQGRPNSFLSWATHPPQSSKIPWNRTPPKRRQRSTEWAISSDREPGKNPPKASDWLLGKRKSFLKWDVSGLPVDQPPEPLGSERKRSLNSGLGQQGPEKKRVKDAHELGSKEALGALASNPTSPLATLPPSSEINATKDLVSGPGFRLRQKPNTNMEVVQTRNLIGPQAASDSSKSVEIPRLRLGEEARVAPLDVCSIAQPVLPEKCGNSVKEFRLRLVTPKKEPLETCSIPEAGGSDVNTDNMAPHLGLRLANSERDAEVAPPEASSITEQLDDTASLLVNIIPKLWRRLATPEEEASEVQPEACTVSDAVATDGTESTIPHFGLRLAASEVTTVASPEVDVPTTSTGPHAKTDNTITTIRPRLATPERDAVATETSLRNGAATPDRAKDTVPAFRLRLAPPEAVATTPAPLNTGTSDIIPQFKLRLATPDEAEVVTLDSGASMEAAAPTGTGTNDIVPQLRLRPANPTLHPAALVAAESSSTSIPKFRLRLVTPEAVVQPNSQVAASKTNVNSSTTPPKELAVDLPDSSSDHLHLVEDGVAPEDGQAGQPKNAKLDELREAEEDSVAQGCDLLGSPPLFIVESIRKARARYRNAVKVSSPAAVPTSVASPPAQSKSQKSQKNRSSTAKVVMENKRDYLAEAKGGGADQLKTRRMLSPRNLQHGERPVCELSGNLGNGKKSEISDKNLWNEWEAGDSDDLSEVNTNSPTLTSVSTGERRARGREEVVWWKQKRIEQDRLNGEEEIPETDVEDAAGMTKKGCLKNGVEVDLITEDEDDTEGTMPHDLETSHQSVLSITKANAEIGNDASVRGASLSSTIESSRSSVAASGSIGHLVTFTKPGSIVPQEGRTTLHTRSPEHNAVPNPAQPVTSTFQDTGPSTPILAKSRRKSCNGSKIEPAAKSSRTTRGSLVATLEGSHSTLSTKQKHETSEIIDPVSPTSRMTGQSVTTIVPTCGQKRRKSKSFAHAEFPDNPKRLRMISPSDSPVRSDLLPQPQAKIRRSPRTAAKAEVSSIPITNTNERLRRVVHSSTASPSPMKKRVTTATTAESVNTNAVSTPVFKPFSKPRNTPVTTVKETASIPIEQTPGTANQVTTSHTNPVTRRALRSSTNCAGSATNTPVGGSKATVGSKITDSTKSGNKSSGVKNVPLKTETPSTPIRTSKPVTKLNSRPSTATTSCRTLRSKKPRYEEPEEEKEKEERKVVNGMMHDSITVRSS